MKIDFSKDFKLTLGEQVRYIAKDKPIAARRFKNDLIKNLKKDLKNLFISKNLFTLMVMKTQEIMFLKGIYVFIKSI